MTKYISILLLCLSVNLIYAQQKESVANGVVTLSTGKMTGFINLRFINDMVVYHDVAEKKETAHKLTDVFSIQDDNQKIIYINEVIALERKKIEDAKRSLVYRANYPEGIYKTKEEFINKKPSIQLSITPVSLDENYYYLDSSASQCFFLKDNGTRLRGVFAVSYDGHLFFRVKSILKNRNKTDRAQTNDLPNSFVRVKNGGDNYLYMEADLANLWAQAAVYGGVGFVAGTLIAEEMIEVKGVVWDIKNQEFNIFKNCNDFNKFITPLYPEGKQECEHQQPNILEVRNAIDKIK